MELSDSPSLKTKFSLPPDVRDLAGYPLYLIVAAWGLRNGHVLSTVMVSRTFFISQGQARDVLHYMRHEGLSRVTSEQVPLKNGAHPYSKGVRVLSVNLTDVSPHEKEERARSRAVRLPPQTQPSRGRDTRESERRLRQWMVSRRPGEVVPDVLLITDRPD